MFIDSPFITSSLTSTGQFVVPFGISGSQTSNPRSGSLFFNLTDDKLISFNGSTWANVGGAAAAESSAIDIEYLNVAGGGAGGKRVGSGDYYQGGGGAGGFLSSSFTLEPGVAITVTVGGGGAGYPGGSSFGQGSNGENSTIIATGIETITSLGGGAGAAIDHPSSDPSIVDQNGESGGSGGGATGWNNNAGIGGSGTLGQGFAGGNGTAGGDAAGAGGGGAGGVGTTNTGTGGRDGGNGGPGKQSNITGTATYYAAGARGGKGYSSTPGVSGTNGTGYTGLANSGDGGIPEDTVGETTGNSGIIILKMLTSNYSGTTTGSPTVTTDGDYTVIKFTASGTYTT